MKFKNLLVSASAAFAIFLGAQAQAQSQPPFKTCLNTPLQNFPGTVVDAALATPELSTLVDLLVAADLVGALEDAENITVYAPTNDAFAAVPEELVGVLGSNVDALTNVLLYHVSPGQYDPRLFITPVKRPTLLEETSVVFHREFTAEGGEQRVNQAHVDCQGVQTVNGRVWFINKVLLPLFASAS